MYGSREYPTKTECQICGRKIKAKFGLIAHHGYKRPGNGWQTVSCSGAKYRPYQVAKDALEIDIPDVEGYIVQMQQEVDDLRNDPPHSITIAKTDLRGRTVYDDDKGRTVYVTHWMPDFFNFEDHFMGNKYAYETQKKMRDMQYQVSSAKDDRDFMKQRLADWKAPK